MRDAGRVARRILAQLVKDPRFLVLSFAVPVLLVLLIDYLLRTIPIFRKLRVPMEVYAMPLAGFVIFFLTYVLCTIVLVRERRDGTLGRMLTCGYRRPSIVLGYVAGYGAVAAVQTALVVATTIWAFDVTLGPRVFAQAGTTLALSVVSLAFGLFVSTLARTEGQIFPTIPLVIVPSILLSGLIIPHDNLPAWLRWLSYAIPLTHAENVLVPIGRGDPFSSVAVPFTALVAYGGALLALASFTIREVE